MKPPRLLRVLAWISIGAALIGALVLQPVILLSLWLSLALVVWLHSEVQVRLWQRALRRWAQEQGALGLFDALPAETRAQIRAVLHDATVEQPTTPSRKEA